MALEDRFDYLKGMRDLQRAVDIFDSISEILNKQTYFYKINKQVHEAIYEANDEGRPYTLLDWNNKIAIPYGWFFNL